MKKIVVILAVLMVLGAGILGWMSYFPKKDVEKDVAICVTVQNDWFTLVSALETRNIEMCHSLPENMQKRCRAWVSGNESECDRFDTDCKAIARKDENACFDPLCKALAQNDRSYCSELTNEAKMFCEKLVQKDSSYFMSNQESCRSYVENKQE